MISGATDPIFNAAAADRFATTLRGSGVALLLVLPWGNHGFDQIAYGPSIQMTLYYMERFIAWAIAEPAV